MRQVSKQVISAFLAGKCRTVGNTRTNGQSLYLHGNCIADKLSDGSIQVSNAGWYSPTTKERLNALMELRGYNGYIFQKKCDWYVRRDGQVIRYSEWAHVI